MQLVLNFTVSLPLQCLGLGSTVSGMKETSLNGFNRYLQEAGRLTQQPKKSNRLFWHIRGKPRGGTTRELTENAVLCGTG